jgi:hypothetical protein
MSLTTRSRDPLNRDRSLRGEAARQLDILLIRHILRGLQTVTHPALPDKGGTKQSVEVSEGLAEVGTRLQATVPRLSSRSSPTTWQGETHGD